MNSADEQVVMTPRGKTGNSTKLWIERRRPTVSSQANGNVHVAGGQHTGIVINKDVATDEEDDIVAQLSLEFRVFLTSAQTGMHTQESRTLRFWFRDLTPVLNGTSNGHVQQPEDATTAQDFFRELVSPQDFPRDYVGFIKKIIKQMQFGYRTVKKIEVELRQLEETSAPPARPISVDESTIGHVVLLSVEKVLELIESSYPNPITIHDMAKDNSWDEEEVAHHMADLQSRGLVKAMDHGAFTRQQSLDTQVTVVKQMPQMSSGKQPTIAIITAQYCEKLAVDAMLDNKETFVRYTTVGESNVYTLGNIGAHRIVCTKLPSVGHTREAMTAAGNTTTRLLGTFQRVDYVFLVGLGGGVPHYTDYNKHVRLGDVVVSCPVTGRDIYIYCDNAQSTANGSTTNPFSESETNTMQFETKSYGPINLDLQDIARTLQGASHLWQKYVAQAQSLLRSASAEHDYCRPDRSTDKLFMSLGDNEMIEVAHPTQTHTGSRDGVDADEVDDVDSSRLHYGPVASGRHVVRSDQLRQAFAARVGARAFDSEYDAVIESVLGNCKESFICVRGISDYKDGTRRTEWQPYAALAAAAVMKAIVAGMPPPTD